MPGSGAPKISGTILVARVNEQRHRRPEPSILDTSRAKIIARRLLARASGLAQADLVLAAAMIAVVWMSVCYHLVMLRGQAEASAAQNTANLARAFEGHVIGVLGSVDEALRRTREAWAQEPERFSLLGREAEAAFGHTRALRVALVGPGGEIEQSSRGPSPDPADFSGREWLQRVAAATDDGLVVGHPTDLRQRGPQDVYLARAVRGPDGASRGVVVATLDTLAISGSFGAVDLGRLGVVALVGSDGVVLARSASGDLTSGQSLSGSSIMTAIKAANGGTVMTRDPSDGMRRVMSFRRLEGYPLHVIVGVGEAEALEAWEWQRDVALLGCGNLTGLILLVSFLSARHRGRVALTGSRLSATLESMSQGIMMVNDERRVVVANGHASQMLGLPQLVKGDVLFDEILRAMDEACEFAAAPSGIAEAWAALEGGVSFEHRRPDGMVLEVRTERLADGSAVRTLTDVTETRRAAEALAAARDAAEAASRARAGFLAMMSHEIRTPMNGVIGMAGLLLDSGLGGERLRHATVLRDSAEDLLRILNDILDFSKMEAAGIRLEEAPFEVEATARSALDTLAPKAVEKGLALSLHVAPGVPRALVGDAGRVRQILLNLVSNAIKFTERGSVTVTVGAEPEQDGGWILRAEVRDTGIGIAPEEMGALFREFSQVDVSITRRFGGTGLGLVICRRLAERMGGAVEVESVPGTGSTFCFRVRLTAAPTASLQALASDKAERPGSSLRILLAEDSPANQMVATALLRRLGHRVDAVENGLEAVEAVRSTGYDLVLMDMMMPEMDGLAAARAIRALPGPESRVRIVALTANAFASDEEECIAAGMDGFVTKPVTRDKLAVAVAAAELG